MANCDPSVLAQQAIGFEGLPDGDKLNILCYLWARIAEVTTDPKTLAGLAACFCGLPGNVKMDILLYLGCQILNSGGTAQVCILGGVGPPAMAVPCNFSAYVQQPGPNFGLWLGDLVTGWAQVVTQGP
jgi:hypothetical protein